ncbi:MAG TPA: hypothetical protein VJN18_33180 [Polyangiaceae bacterium]|nr:hypothetical protein [Polyangiaceae bacterium]
MEIIVVSALEGTPEVVGRANRLLGELGLRRAASNVYLPPGTFMGVWVVPEATIEEIRTTLVYSLEQTGVTVVGLLVASFNELAWRGPAVVPNAAFSKLMALAEGTPPPTLGALDPERLKR